MTNLLTTPRQPWLTRGRLLVGLPLGLGVVVSAAVVLLAVRPLLQTVQGLEERRDTLLGLQRSLPVLERQLTQAEAELRMAEEKQALLVGLLAGREKVQTFLALLNQQALASGVRIQRYEPLKTAAPTPASEQRQSRRNNNRSNEKEKAQLPQDPLQALGYRKSSVALEVSGPFGGLQTFLQRMEALELLVESSDLALKSVVGKKDAEPVMAAAARTQLTLKLSFYDLASMPDVSLTSASMSSPS
ncbi:hypothetical protein Q3Y53_02740 [Synechococcus sp. YX-04-1]|uniref:hypothetical protein n=1 Tax=Synechococcus sp. YX-04-1 TaxID=3062778 RepID=UPI0026E1197C|nr:hypothetical protein [Synechococcus sp. YX-04-1]MDO6351450.1 hypothetical protein [Synechococcus sp. YX-04-1]